jgi:hypothetical protein
MPESNVYGPSPYRTAARWRNCEHSRQSDWHDAEAASPREPAFYSVRRRDLWCEQAGGPLDEARPPATRRGQFLPNGRLPLKRPESAAETAIETAKISYQTEIRG